MKIKIMAAVAGVVLLAGCGGPAAPIAETPKDVPSSPVTSAISPPPSHTPTPTPTPTPKPTATGPTVLDGGPGKVGDWIKVGDVKAQVIQFNPKDSSTQNQQPDQSALVRVCSITGTHEVSWLNWFLGDHDDGQYKPFSYTQNDYPKPLFPFGGQSLSAGSCVQGWVLFATNADTKALGIGFFLDDDGTAWKV